MISASSSVFGTCHGRCLLRAFSRASSLASSTLSPPRLTADVRFTDMPKDESPEDALSTKPKEIENPIQSEHELFKHLIFEFAMESDRASVILACAVIDDALRDLIESFLVPCPSSTDPLFDEPNAPLSTFSSRIEFAFRTGLITNSFSRCLHIARKIRNAFAHDIEGCSFESQSVLGRIEALRRATHFRDIPLAVEDIDAPRNTFAVIAAFFIWQIRGKTRNIVNLRSDSAFCCDFRNPTNT